MTGKIPSFNEKLDQCVSDNTALFEAHIKETAECNDHLDIMKNTNKDLLIAA